MADWTTIADASIEAGKPIRAIDGRALRDNPIAIAQGAAGAPRIAGQQGPAVETGGITNRHLIGLHAARVTDASIPVLTVSASDNVNLDFAAPFTQGALITSSVSFVAARTYIIRKATGTARFRASHRVEAGNPTIELRLLRNGSQIAIFSHSGINFLDRVVDSAIAENDVFVWEHRRTSGTPESSSEVAFFAARATNGYTSAPLLIAVSDL